MWLFFGSLIKHLIQTGESKVKRRLIAMMSLAIVQRKSGHDNFAIKYRDNKFINNKEHPGFNNPN